MKRERVRKILCGIVPPSCIFRKETYVAGNLIKLSNWSGLSTLMSIGRIVSVYTVWLISRFRTIQNIFRYEDTPTPPQIFQWKITLVHTLTACQMHWHWNSIWRISILAVADLKNYYSYSAFSVFERAQLGPHSRQNLQMFYSSSLLP